MRKSFVYSVLSTQKNRQRYFYFKNTIAAVCGIAAYVKISSLFGSALGVGVAVIAAILAYLTVAPVIAFLICLFEQIAS